jgi:predicted ribosome quality control (RQC) complex YloA/Tae2 family protein
MRPRASATDDLAVVQVVSYRDTGMKTPGGAERGPRATFDSLVLAAVLAECRDLLGARLARVFPTDDEKDFALGLRARGRARTVRISAHPQWGRMHLTEEVNPTGATPFTALLRGRLAGGVLRAIEAPAFERLVTLTFETLEGPYDLVVELMGRHANVVLCREGRIVGALKPVGHDRARGREVLPGRPYVRPASPRTDPTTVTAADLLAAAEAPAAGGADEAERRRPAWRVVLEATGGIGPAIAWEACLRAGADPVEPLQPSATEGIVGALRAIGHSVLAGEFSPVLYRDHAGRPVAYAVFPLRVFAALPSQPCAMSAAVEAVTARAVSAARVASLRADLAAVVARAAARTERAIASVAADLRAADDAERLRECGELILTYLRRIGPGQREIEVPGYDGGPVRIALDPGRSPVENAQAYFRQYARAAAARARLPARVSALESERQLLAELAVAIAVAETADDLRVIEQDLIASGWRRGREPSRHRPPAEGRVFDLPGGARIMVGRSARENERLTFAVAGPDDLWLHARGMPGAHVILRGSDPSDEVIATAAAVAAYYSAGRHAAKVPVDVTRRKHVRKVRGGSPGQVTYTHERTLMVAPALPAAARVDLP